jgi:chorismate mutase/prephenate dehydratase
VPSASIEELRARIDQIDDRILKLLNDRARLAIAVGHHKSGQGRATYAPEREKRIFGRLARSNGGPLEPDHVRAIYREIISSCLALEEPLRIAYLGPEGTYSQEAAATQFGSGAKLAPFVSIDAIFDEVERARADYGVVPVENSTEGVVAQTLDRFVSSPLTIKAEVVLRIDHCLLVRTPSLALPRFAGEGKGKALLRFAGEGKGAALARLAGEGKGSRSVRSAGGDRLARLKRIVSHPQSLAQCRTWLAQHCPGVPLEEVASNAVAASLAARHAGTAAIAGRRAAERYGLEVLAASIQDLPNNVTRVLVVSGDGLGRPTGDDKTSILFSVPHQAGALHRVLEVFARNRINLSTIESRPLKGRAWEYVFFLDLTGHVAEPAMGRALAALGRRAQFVKILGSYPAARWPEPEGSHERE